MERKERIRRVSMGFLTLLAIKRTFFLEVFNHLTVENLNREKKFSHESESLEISCQNIFVSCLTVVISYISLQFM